MYATDFFDQVEHRILPALRSGTVVLADRFIFTLIARGVVRGINRDYIGGLYAMALRPHLTFWLNVRPETAFGRERSEEHTSELQSPCNLVCRLLLEKKKRTTVGKLSPIVKVPV